MPRRSRVKDNYGVYHIKQNGSPGVKLFAGADDRESFLDIIKKVRDKNNFKLLAYCITEEDEYHLILDANGCDISKLMKEINIKYSLYKDCAGCLFKDRFRSELLNSSFKLNEVEAFTASNDKNNNLFSACGDFLKKLEEMSILDQTQFRSDPAKVQAVFQRGCVERVNTMEEATAHLNELAHRIGKSLDDVLKDKPLRNELILKMKSCSTLSMKQIGTLFGGLSESSVSKLLNAGIKETDNLK